MQQIPFAFQCTFHENKLLALKDSVNGNLHYAPFSNISGFKYWFTIFPNGDTEAARRQTWIFLFMKLGNVKKVEADFTIIIESANSFFNLNNTYEKTTGGWGFRPAYTKDFLNPEMKFIVDGKCTIRVYGVFKFSDAPISDQQKWYCGEFGNGLWDDDGDRDFTIVVDGKEIKVHKLFLRTRSDVFKAMLNPETKESIENKVEIPDFTFDVVETAVKMIYNYGFTSFLSLDELMSLLQFFDKYQIPLLKNKVEPFLINQISAATVCRLTNCSIFTNSILLKINCIDFLEKSFASKIPLSDIQILDKDVAVKFVQLLDSHAAEIQ